MFSLEVIAKRGGEVSQILVNEVSLKAASVVRIGLSSDRIKGMRRVGNDLVVTAVSGEVITIHDFFTAFDGNRNDLVLNDDQEGMWLAEISDNQGDLAVEYLDIDSIEPLLLHQDFELGLVPFLVGGALAGGVAFASRGDDFQAFVFPSALPAPGDTIPPAAPTINPTNGKLITGLAEAGSVITIKDDSGNIIGSTTAASDGTYTIAPANPPKDGTALHAVATDAAGNASPEATAAVDGKPPVIGIAILNDANKDGFINASEKGADVTVQVTLVSGATAGDVITLAAGTASSSITLTAADVANGFVNASFANPVEGDAISVSATSRDMAGNVSPPVTTGNVRLDTSAPGAPAIGAASDDMGPVQGPLASGGITDDTTPTLTGSGATPGDVIKVYDNGSAIGSTTVRADGGWSFTPPKPLPEGTHRLTTTAVDPAGNESRPSAAFTVEVDTTPPAALEASVIQVLDDIGAVRGPIAAGAQTDDSKPEYVGKADPAQVSSVRVYDNGTLIGSTAVNADGTWRFTPALPLSTGAHSFTAQAVDVAGNASPLTPASTFTLLGDAPAAPAIVGVSDNKGSINGNIAKDASTDDNTPTLSGTGTVGTVVTVYADGVAVGSASVAANGTWSVTTDPLTGDGVKNLSAIAVDGAGQASPATGDYPIVLDTTAPATPATLVATDDQGAVTGAILAGGSTDDASPTFSGTGARTGDIAKLYDGATPIGSTAVKADGSWSLTPDKPLGQGAHSITHTLTDAAGNTSAASAPLAFTVDTSNVVVSVGHAVDDQGSKQGNLAPGALTDDTTPTLVGTATAMAVVTVTENATVIGSTTADGNGNWRLTLPAQAEGTHKYTATAVNAAGTKGEASLSLTIDTTAPTAPSIAKAIDDVGSVQGPLTSGSSTDDTTPTLTGSGATPGDVIRVYDNASPIGSATVLADGSWSFTPTTPLAEGTHRLSTSAIDAAGNESPRSGDFTVDVDTTPPSRPDASLIQVLDDVGAVQGPIASGAQTDDSRPTYTGKADPAQVSSINVYDNGSLIGSTAVNADGTWRFEPALPLSTGAHSLTAQAVDAAGNASALTPASTFTLLGTAPAAPAITGVSDNRGGVTGNIAKDTSTDDNTPTLSGTGSVGTVVTVYADGVAVGSASVAANGTWSVTTDPLGADGVKNLSAIAVDGAGQASPATGIYPIVLDTAPPATPGVVVATDKVGAVQGTVASGGTTDDVSPTFSGSGVKAGDTVRVYDGATLIGSATVATDGGWSVTPAASLGAGLHSITQTVTDAAGNTSAASAPLAFTVDTSDVIVSVKQAQERTSGRGARQIAGLTNDTTPTLAGKATAGAVVTVTEGAAVLGSATADASGNWSLTLPEQAEGAHEYKATAVNAAGTNGQAILGLTIDTTPPKIPAIDQATDDVGTLQGPLANGGASDDTTPTLTGSGATAGDAITVYDNGSAVGSTTVKADGSWSFTPTTPLAEGAHRLTTTATDPVGNESKPSSDFVITVDTVAPATPVAATGYADNVGAIQNPASTARITDDTTPGINIGTLLNGLTPSLYVDGTKVASTYDPVAGTLTPNVPLGDGAHQLGYTLTDAAGNESMQAPALAVTVSTNAPAAPVAASGYADNVGAVQSPNSTAPATDDATPGLNIAPVPSGSTPSLYVDGTKVAATYDPALGTLTPDAPLAEGAHRLSYTLTNTAGNESAQAPALAVVVDKTAPVAPVMPTSYADDIGTVRNPASTAPSTDDSMPGLNIGTVPADTTPSLYVDGTKVAATYDPAAGTLTPNAPLAEGSHRLSYTLTDAAGNESAPSGALVVSMDITPPPALDASVLQVLDDVGSTQGPIASGAQTDDSKPTYAGKADTAQVASVNVYDNGMLLGSTAVNADGTWRFTPALPLATGPHSFTAQAVDAAGNVSAATPASTFTLLGDAPAAPAITGVSDDKGSVSGSIAQNASTDDNTPTLSGTGTVGTVVTVYADGVAVGSTSVAANGTWSVTTSPLSGDGVKNLKAIAVDGAGQASPATGDYPIVLDTTAPATPATVVATDDQGAVTGAIPAGGSTDDASPTFSGSGARAGDTVKLYDGAALIGSTAVKADGTWSLTPEKPLAKGAHSITHTLTDAAGNTSAASAPLSFAVDTSGVVVSITHAVDDQGSKQGNLAPGAVTDDTTPTLVGTATAGSIITIREDSSALGSTTADTNGNWSLALPVQAEGAHRYTATAVNAAGTKGEATLALTIDTTAPNVPTIAKATDDVGSVQGPLATGGASDDTTPTLSGAGATPGDVIKVYDNGSPIGSTTVQADGSWSFTPTTPLAEGTHQLITTSIDPVGNESKPSGSFVVNVDTTAPGTPVAATGYADNVGAIQSPASTARITDDTTPGINIGTVDADLKPSLYVDGIKVASTYDPVAGTLTPNVPLGDGAHQIGYTLTDAAGNESKPAPALAVTVSTNAPAAPVAASGYADNVGAVQSPNSTAPTTDDTTPGINIGTVTKDFTPALYVDGTKVASTYDPVTGTLTPTTALPEGAHQISYTLTDTAGNESKPAPALSLAVDKSAPAIPAIGAASDNMGSVQGPLANGSSTDDTTPTLSGNGATPGDVIKVYDNATPIGSTTVQPDGSWSFTPATPLTEGTHRLTTTAVDPAGNESAPSGAFTVSVDTTAPATLDASKIQVLDDVGVVQGPIASGAQTDDSKPEYVGKADPAQVASVNVYDNGKLIGSTAVNADGTWRFTPALPLTTGPHSLTAQAVDAAGNVSAATPASTFTLLGDAPAAPAITGVSDDKGSISGSIAQNASTDDNTPTLSGTGTVGTVVTVYADGVAVGSTSVAANGTWSVTTSPLSGDGIKNLKAIAVDGAGQASPATGAYPIVLDTTPPATPISVVATDDQGAVTGAIPAGGSTDDASPTFSGSGAKAGDVVKVYDGAALIGSAAVASDGKWSLALSTPLGDGAHSITHTLTDAAGNTSAASAPLAFAVDTANVVVSVGHAVDDQGSKQGNLAPGALTDDTTPTLVGKATRGAIVTVHEESVVLGSTTADTNGNWSLTLPAQVEGTHKYTATAVNAAGTKGEASLSLTIDTTAPNVPAIGKATDDVGSVQGRLMTGGYSDDTTPTLSGEGATPGDVIKVYDNGSAIGSTTVKADGSWSFTPTTPLAEGTHQLTATAIDPVGNESPRSGAFVVNVDTTAPGTPVAATGYADNVGAIQNPASNAATTDDTTPGLNIGPVSADLTPSLYVDGVKVASTYDPVAGTLTPNVPLGDGAHQIGYTLTDAAGNESGQAPALSVAVRTGAPGAPSTPAGYADNVGAIQSPASTAPTTDDATPGLNIGPVSSGLTPSLYVDDAKVAASYDPVSGTLTPNTPLAEGEHRISYTLTDTAGNESRQAPALVVTVDRTAPTAPKVPASYADNVGTIQSPASTAATTDDAMPGINIGTVASGSTPSLYVDGARVAAIHDAASGTLTPSAPLAEGSHRLSYTLTDAAGNESPQSGALVIDVDTTVPATLDASKIQVLDDVGAVQGPIASGAQTDDSKPEYIGKADPAQVASVNVYDNGKLIGSTAVNADGTWRFTPALPLTTGPHSFTAQAVDAAGNVSAITPASTFTLLGDAPAAPAITGVSDDKGSVSGSIAQNASTDDNTPTLSGTGTVGTVVTVYADGVAVGSTSVAANGTWSVTTSPLSGDGVKNLKAIAVDGAGQASPATGDYPIVLDTTAPATPATVVATDDQGAVTGAIPAGGSTDDASPTFSGSGARAGDTVKLYDGAALIGSTAVKADGTWSLTPEKPLAKGAHSITHTLTDAAGNTSAASAPLSFTVDTSGVVVSITHAVDDQGSKQGNLAPGAVTDDTTPTLVGTATAGSIITIREDSSALGSTTADTNGNWSLALPVQAEGAHKYTATAVNAAGTKGEATLALTIDTTAPNVPTIAKATDDVGSVQGPLATGGASDDTTPTLSGAGATPGDVIKVYDNGSPIGSTTVQADGSWSFTPTTPLAEGTHQLTTTSIDPVGNESKPSGSFVVNVDTTPPTAKATLSAIGTDTGTSSSDFVTSDRTLVATVTVDKAMEPGATVQISLDNGRTWNKASLVGGDNYQFDNTATALADGSHTFLARVVDAAGNAGSPTSQVVVIDTSAPTADNAVAITAYIDDVAPNTGEYGTGTSTNDTTPTLKGTVSGLKTGDVVQIYEGTTLLGTATVSGSAWTFATPALADGSTHSYTAAIADAAGNRGTASGAFSLTVDTTVPTQAVTIVSYTDDIGTNRGDFASGTSTDDTAPVLNGKLSEAIGATDVVRIYEGTTLLGTATVTGTSWIFAVPALASGSTHSYTAAIADAAGNVGAASPAFTLTVDTTPPAQSVTITAYTDDVGTNRGDFASGTTTDDMTPLLRGTLSEAIGATDVVRIYEGTALLGTATVTGTSWTFATPALANGSTHTYKAVVADAAGNQGAASSAFTLTVSTSAPAQTTTITAYTDNVGPIQGDFASGTSTDDTTPVLRGELGTAIGATDTVRVYEGTTLLGTATVTGTRWSFATSTLAEGSTHSYMAVVTDAAGNEGAPSSRFTLTVDTTAPTQAVAITSYLDNQDPQQGTFASGSKTNDTAPQLNGTLAGTLGAGEVVALYRDGVRLGAATMTGAATWTFQDTGLVDGTSYSYTARVEDAAGNRGGASAVFTLVVDQSAPSAAPSIDSITDDVMPVTGPITSGSTTNDTRPELKGSGAEPNGTVRIYDSGRLIGTATADGTGTWSFTPAAGSELSNGAHSLTVSNVDTPGNEGPKSVPVTFTVDTVAPATPPSIDSATDDVAPVVGPISAGSTTNDARPELKGTGAEPNGTVRVYDNGALIGSATADGTGKWSFTPEMGKELANGAHSLAVSSVDAAGNEGPKSAPLAFTVDTVAPTAAPSIDALIDDTEPVTGPVTPGGTTNDTRPELKGAGAEPNGIVRVYDNGALIGSATADAAGKWSFTPEAGKELANGAHSLAASNVDAAGNEGPKSAPTAFTVATVAPTGAPSIDSVTDDVAPATGPIVSGSTTNDTRPELKGSGAQPNGTVRIYDNGALIGSTTADASGKWSFTPEAGKELANGAHSLTVSNVDAAGNEGPKSTPLAFTVDTVVPSTTPSIDSVTDDVAPVTGPITSGSTTNDARPELKGSGAEPNGTVRVYDNGALIGTAAADASGKWSFTPEAGKELANGAHSLAVSNVDAAGNEGPKSAPVAFTVDTVAPSTAPSIDSVTDDVAPVTGPIIPGGTTNDARPELKGSGAEPNGTVRIYDNGALIGTATADASGKWSFTPEAGKELANGAHSLTTSNVDAAGNEGPKSAPLAFAVDTVAPSSAPSIDSLMDGVAPVTGPIASGSTTNETRPVLKGAGAEPNGTVRIYDNGTLIGSASADGAGNWSFTPEAGKELANGAHSLAVSNVDAAGNEGPKSAPLAFTVDTVPPPVATLGLDNYLDSFAAAGTLAANQSSDRYSNDNTFDLVLTGADTSAASYEVSTDGGTVWKATTAAQSNLSDGKYLFRATLTDAAGNSTAAASLVAVTVDRTAPGLDLQRVGGRLVAGKTEAGALVAIDVGNNGSVEASVTADADGNWTWTPSTSIAANTVVSAVAYDLAGNASSKGSQAADTTPPEVTIQKSDGTRFSGTTSDADTPTVSPTSTRPITVTLSVDRNADGVIDYMLPFTATVTADGAWSIDASSAPVNIGAIVTAVARDYNGNASAPAVVTVGGGTSRISGTTKSDNFGYDVQAIGDFNGDGYNDFAVVAPHGSSAERSANKWSVNILYGSKQGLPDLSSVSNLPGTDGLKIFTSGDISDSNILTAVQGYGDVNGDGYSDVILYDDNLNSAWVIFGRSSEGAGSAPVNVDVRTIISSGGDSNGVAIVQREGGSTWFGAAGALVDVNGDGYADIIMQDWQRGTGSSGTAILYGHTGAAGSAAWSNYYVGFTGSSPASYVSDNRNSSTESTRPHTIIYNDNTNGYPTNVMNIGDINGDGYADFAYGMYNARNPAGNIDNAGAIQVIYGTSKGFPQDYSLQTDYTNISNGFRVYGEQANQYLGTYIDPEPYGYLSNTGMPISSGDVNGDGIADMIIGSPQFGPDAGEQRGPGRVYVVYGKAGGAASNVNLANLSSADGFVITASDSTADAMFGNGTSVGDFNGDGIDDIAIGAPLADVGGINNGAVYILYGQQGGYSGFQSVTAAYRGTQSATVFDANYRQNGDANSGSMLGVNVALSDLNGDGQADLALGSPYHDMPWSAATGYLEVVYADAFNFTNLLTVGDDVIKATDGRDRLSGGAGNDVITGVRTGDSAYGGAGNDRIHIEEINGVVRVDGGLGIDTLVVDASNITLDLAALGLKVKGFENFDLGTGAANKGNALKLRLSDVLNQQSSTGTVNGTGQGHLRVTGDSDDTVQLLHGSDKWSNTGSRTVDGVNYNIYHNSTMDSANTLGDIWIQQGISVI
ncbi:Ig-like domain-containing protein [Variovorax sp. AB1(2024)]|uniref:Ig-like domain-containing protein n=1 Tax=Variovorax sp. AB1(2024) TaxID=3132214 RepID=UPI0030AE5736